MQNAFLTAPSAHQSEATVSGEDGGEPVKGALSGLACGGRSNNSELVHVSSSASSLWSLVFANGDSGNSRSAALSLSAHVENSPSAVPLSVVYFQLAYPTAQQIGGPVSCCSSSQCANNLHPSSTIFCIGRPCPGMSSAEATSANQTYTLLTVADGSSKAAPLSQFRQLSSLQNDKVKDAATLRSRLTMLICAGPPQNKSWMAPVQPTHAQPM